VEVADLELLEDVSRVDCKIVAEKIHRNVLRHLRRREGGEGERVEREVERRMEFK
jgi:hypothetical protein